MSSSAPAIETEKLTKYYGTARGIIDLDLRVEEGEIFGFLGPNGAGKTTAIRILMDLIRPTSGHASVFGKDAQADSIEIKSIVGYLPGELAFWNNLTGRQIVTYMGNLRGGVDPKTIDALAARLELDLNRKFREYSKGNKQKVGLVQAFMHKPRLLILDEPTGGLDPLNQQEFFRIVTEAQTGGATVFLSSHVLSEIEHTCDRVGIIREGRMVRVGSVRDLVGEKVNRVTLHLGVAVSDDIVLAFQSLPNVNQVTATDHALELVVQGDLDLIIKTAAAYPVLSMTSHEPTLEETFLAYYKSS